MNVKDADAFAGAIVNTIKSALKTPTARIAELEQRISELEARPLLKYAGVWQSGESYQEGRLVTHQGGLWLSTEATSATPGSAGSGFRLIVKRGGA